MLLYGSLSLAMSNMKIFYLIYQFLFLHCSIILHISYVNLKFSYNDWKLQYVIVSLVLFFYLEMTWFPIYGLIGKLFLFLHNILIRYSWLFSIFLCRSYRYEINDLRINALQLLSPRPMLEPLVLSQLHWNFPSRITIL